MSRVMSTRKALPSIGNLEVVDVGVGIEHVVGDGDEAHLGWARHVVLQVVVQHLRGERRE